MPFAKADADSAAELLDIDRQSVFELIELLMLRLYKAGLVDSIPGMLDTQTHAVEHKLWARDCAVLRAQYWEFCRSDSGNARQLLNEIVEPESESDYDTLELWWIVNHDTLGFDRQRQTLERMIALARTPVEKALCVSRVAMQLVAIGDPEGATRRFEEVLELLADAAQEVDLDGFGQLLLARGLRWHGVLADNREHLERATAMMKDLSEDPDLTYEGLAEMLCELADRYDLMDDLGSAQQTLDSIPIQDRPPVALVLQARLALGRGESSACIDLNEAIDLDGLPTETAQDLVELFGNAALLSGDKDLIARAVDAIATHMPTVPA